MIRKIVLMVAVYIITVAVGCSQLNNCIASADQVSSSSISSNVILGSGVLGSYSLNIDIETLSAELTPIRSTSSTDVLEAVDLTNFMTLSPCKDCARIGSVGIDGNDNLVVSIGIKHPFNTGNPSEPISGKNRADLHVFNVEGILAINDTTSIEFADFDKSIAPARLMNASGYTSYLDNVLDLNTYQTSADIHPYILHFDDYSTGNYSPLSTTGFTSVTDPPSGNLVMPMGSGYDYKNYIFNIDQESMNFVYVIGCTYPLASTSYTERFTPEYRVPQHLKKAASEVSILPIADTLKELTPSYEITVQVEIVDRSHDVTTGSGLDDMRFDSSVDTVEIEIPGVITGIYSQNGGDSISGSGHSSSDPLLYNFTISNEEFASVGSFIGLLKVTDSYPSGFNESLFLMGEDGLMRVPPGTSTLDGTFTISEFATYAVFEVEVELGEINPPTYYDVGPGHPYADPSEVPWESIEENSLVRIFWREEPYRDKWVIARAGTQSEPIIIRGMPDAGRRPVIHGENAKTRQELDYWNEVRSVIKVGGSSHPSERPSWITIENLDIRSAHPDYSFTDDNGSTQTYSGNGASVHIESGDNITLRNCILHDSGNGLFVGSESYNVMVEGNHIHDNGNTDSQYEHNSYTEAHGITFQYNFYGPLKTGSLGNNLKDRSMDTVIRYNWIYTGSRMCDLVDSDHQDIIDDPAYRKTWVYGNVLIKTSLHGNGAVIHYGGDSSDYTRYRKGTLWFFNNTVISYRTTRTTLLQISTNDESVKCFNNLFFDEVGGDQFFICSGPGIIDFYNNWIQPDWNQVNGTLTGTFNEWDNIEGSNPGFVDFGIEDFHLDIGSPCLNIALALPSPPLPNHDLLNQYVKHQGNESRSDDGSLDIGAFEME